jgi:light-regulated signal transduction histidine kinase (bacteriophytochrome)
LISQKSCDAYEETIKELTKSEFSLPEAEKIFKEYTALECADMLLAFNFIGIYCKEDEPPRINISTKKSKNHLRITVSDNGIGIAESYQDTIFEMFKRLKSKKAEGTGIGLASCKKIVEKHGGKISVNSTEGEGSNFIIEIPNL